MAPHQKSMMHSRIFFGGIATALFIASTVPTSAAQCAIYRGAKLIEKNHCTHKYKPYRGVGEGRQQNIYTWATGGKTLVENVEEWFTINGKDGEYDSDDGRRNKFAICIKNLSSGNTFCSTGWGPN